MTERTGESEAADSCCDPADEGSTTEAATETEATGTSADDDGGHGLSAADLQYPTFEFDEGSIDAGGEFELSKSLGREGMGDMATDLAGALSSHDLGVTTPDGFTTFGIAPKDVTVSFEPDEGRRGELSVTFRLSAKAMFIADGDTEQAGARSGKGFVPLSMLTDDRKSYRCYNWVGDTEQSD